MYCKICECVKFLNLTHGIFLVCIKSYDLVSCSYDFNIMNFSFLLKLYFCFQEIMTVGNKKVILVNANENFFCIKYKSSKLFSSLHLSLTLKINQKQGKVWQHILCHMIYCLANSQKLLSCIEYPVVVLFTINKEFSIHKGAS